MFRAVVLFSLLSFIPFSVSHNWLIKPPPYNRKYKRTRDCAGVVCRNACPQKRSPPWNTRESPAALYRRGETIDVRYTKNNHHGGLMRISLVPVDKMFDRDWHVRMTLMHGCWESGEYTCKSGDCGTDKQKEAFRLRLRIPDQFPDGDYVLGYVWYGGLHFKRDYGSFPDFFSCSHVRISGGNPLSPVPYKPYFEPGRGRRIKNGMCETSADAVGQCGNTGCPEVKSFFAIPKVFRNGAPDPITPARVASGFAEYAYTRGTSDTKTVGSMYEIEETGKSGPPGNRTGKYAKHRTSNNHNGNHGKTKNRSKRRREEDEKQVKPGVCRGSICCAASCGRCGGDDCHKLPGGGEKCCFGRIKESRRYCNKYAPPCIRV